uniref:Coiled-coil domain containing 65 n=1 Tax=Anser brachyrhynchus TaxID=132585 RepID=A0A8B9BHR6_9AVES
GGGKASLSSPPPHMTEQLFAFSFLKAEEMSSERLGRCRSLLERLRAGLLGGCGGALLRQMPDTVRKMLWTLFSEVKSLVMDVEEAEAQHARALGSHLRNVDRLLQLQRSRLACLEEGFHAQLQVLKAEFETERRAILEQHEDEIRYLQDVVLALEQNYARDDHEATTNFQSARDDIKSKSLQEKQYSRLQLGGKMEGLWEQFHAAIQSYTEATEHWKIAFEGLKQKDVKSCREIEMQAKKLQKLQVVAKARLAARLRENEEQNRHAREEKEAALGQLQELKSQMNQAWAKVHGSLARLTAQSEATLKAVAQAVGKAERVLRLAEMGRRLETEAEKVLPFYLSSLAEGELFDADRVLKEKPAESLGGGLDYVGLERFWQRFNKVRLEERALAQQLAAVSRKNQQLRGLLQQYLEGLSVSPEVLSRPNPLLAVKHKSRVPRACARRHQGAAPPLQPPWGRRLPGPHPQL